MEAGGHGDGSAQRQLAVLEARSNVLAAQQARRRRQRKGRSRQERADAAKALAKAEADAEAAEHGLHAAAVHDLSRRPAPAGGWPSPAGSPTATTR